MPYMDQKMEGPPPHVPSISYVGNIKISNHKKDPILYHKYIYI